MAIEALIGKFSGDNHETIALVNNNTGCCLPCHTFKSVEAAEDYLMFLRDNGYQHIMLLTLGEHKDLWDEWWEKRGKDESWEEF